MAVGQGLVFQEKLKPGFLLEELGLLAAFLGYLLPRLPWEEWARERKERALASAAEAKRGARRSPAARPAQSGPLLMERSRVEQAKKNTKPPQPAAAAERNAPWRLAVAVALLCTVAAGAARLAVIKTLQHHRLQVLAPLVPQGEAEGQVSLPLALKPAADGSLWALSRWKDTLRLQLFDASFRFQKAWVLDKSLFDTRDMALDPSGRLVLALGDGRLVPLDDKFKPGRPLATGLGSLRALEALPKGGWLVYAADHHTLVTLAQDGAFVSELRLGAWPPVRDIAVTASGRVALLEEKGDRTQLRVLTPDLKVERLFRAAAHKAGEPNRVAACDGELLIMNDAGGAKGVFFYNAASGHLVAESLGSDRDLLIHPGFVAGDPARRVAWVHFGAGLLKVMTPREGI